MSITEKIEKLRQASQEEWDWAEHLRKLNMTKWDSKEYLSKLYDKQLKDLRTNLYAGLRNMNVVETPEGYKYDVSGDKRGWLVSKEEVMAELATRGDIPNKKEAKEIRQKRAKKKF